MDRDIERLAFQPTLTFRPTVSTSLHMHRDNSEELRYTNYIVHSLSKSGDLMGLNAIDIPADLVVAIINELKKDDDGYRHHIYPYGGDSIFFRNLRLDWLTSTQFCKSWRQAALDCASLWADIDVTYWSENMITEFLSRSRDSALSLAIVIPIPESAQQAMESSTIAMPNKLARCLNNLYRTRSLAVTIFSYGCWQEFLGVLQSAHTPLLEHFAFDGYSLRFDGPVSLGLPLFKNFTPRLHSLALRSVALPCDSSVLMPSTSLLLELVVCRGRQSLDEILQRCSSLSVMTIDSVKVVDEQGDKQTFVPIGHQPVLLPYLKSITLCGSTALCNMLTSICQYPSNATSSWAYMFLDEDALPSFPASNISGQTRACLQVQKKSLMEVQWGGADLNDLCSFGVQRTATDQAPGALWSFVSLNKFLDGAVNSVDSFTLYIEKSHYVDSDLLSCWKALLQYLRGLRHLTIRFNWDIDEQFLLAFGDEEALALPELTDLVLVFKFLNQGIIDALNSSLTKRNSSGKLKHLGPNITLIGERAVRQMEDKLDILRPLVTSLKVDDRGYGGADKVVNPKSFRIYHRMSRYGRKTEFRA